MHVRLRNDRTGELKEVKIGFSWTLLLFSTFLGIPLFLRKLPVWGGAMLVLCLVYWILEAVPMPDDGTAAITETDFLFLIVSAVMLAFTIFFGVKGNELTAKNLLENGWSFADDDDRTVAAAKSKWSLP